MGEEQLQPSEGEGRKDFDFDRYRAIVDSHTEGARKLGLQDKADAERAVADPRTVTVEVEGMKFPVLAPIELAEGYDAERTRNIVAQSGGNPQEAYYFCLPPGLADDAMRQNIVEQLREYKPGEMSVFFEYDSEDLAAKQEFEQILSALGREVSSIPLTDEEVQAENEQAALGLYVTSVYRSEQATELPITGRSLYDEFRAAVEEGSYDLYPENGATLLKSADISAELRDKMWEIYIDRFQNLGQYHPITMEDTREGFEELVNHPETAVSVCFKDGEPVCWMCFLTDMEECSWLNDAYFTQEKLQMQEDESLLFFPEIVARADNIGGYSEPTIELAAQMTARSGVNYKVVFESTNRSVEYIPYLVKKYAESTGLVQVEEAVEVDKTMYGCYRVE